MEIKIINEKKNMYILDDGRVKCFLFVGDKDALLVDTGFFDVDIVPVVKEITTLPIKVVLTHGDGDHTGSLGAFGECYVHEGDKGLIPENVTTHDIKDGDHIGAGDYDFEVIHIPGHTYGSIAFLEKKHRFILTGDGIQKDGNIFMFGEKRNFQLYLDSLKKLSGMTEYFDEIYPSHSICPIEKEAIEKCLIDATNLYEGKIKEFEKHEFMPCNVYKGSYTGYLYQPE